MIENLIDFKKFNLMAFEASSGADRAMLAAELDTILQESGFLFLTGHGVRKDIIESLWQVVLNFFSQPEEMKRKVSVPHPGYPYGWIGQNQESLAASKGFTTLPDLKESFNGGPPTIPLGLLDKQAYEFCYQPTIFPDLEGFKEAWTLYYVEMEKLAKRIMRTFAEALGLEKMYFDKFILNPISALRALYYPATHKIESVGQQRAGAHTDYGSLTILLPEKGSNGLQVFLNNQWIDVPTEEDCFIINIGDLMEHWTSGKWISTSHRVFSQPEQPSRYSLAFFHQPDWDAEIVPICGTIPEKTVQSGPYLMSKFLSTTKPAS